ncbi:unnamed protein product [Ceratitis capitata]|uniref:(Mediterranean fruit fly) hypothetical protein n=1 Tax=Ceratitis capitata TaxID=7213 RepID=A0A811V1E6_CERCA|nr:unnamed protein product [Ceratitis capitata]
MCVVCSYRRGWRAVKSVSTDQKLVIPDTRAVYFVHSHEVKRLDKEYQVYQPTAEHRAASRQHQQHNLLSKLFMLSFKVQSAP